MKTKDVMISLHNNSVGLFYMIHRLFYYTQPHEPLYAKISIFQKTNVAPPNKQVACYTPNLPIKATSLQQPLSSIPKVAVEEKFICITI